ncbi:MAG: hypothetical protein JO250_03340 [Armatimonadetes bacterium]|nr:hypothetical protein [Armatimonadota bacterium]
MAKIKSIELTGDERAVLEKAWRRVGCCEQVVNTWLGGYRARDLDGPKTCKGRSRRAILQQRYVPLEMAGFWLASAGPISLSRWLLRRSTPQTRWDRRAWVRFHLSGKVRLEVQQPGQSYVIQGQVQQQLAAVHADEVIFDAPPSRTASGH